MVVVLASPPPTQRRPCGLLPAAAGAVAVSAAPHAAPPRAHPSACHGLVALPSSLHALHCTPPSPFTSLPLPLWWSFSSPPRRDGGRAGRRPSPRAPSWCPRGPLGRSHSPSASLPASSSRSPPPGPLSSGSLPHCSLHVTAPRP
eukprot:TRINITY_DN4350_c1_g1_i1.p2 TRINITY_DN4350_c1_g1~~TRINITY_DN4350_c1_g1_i1.p2  ORF type:complete len:145 (-),score=4.05 TRINITY_DN4350_c1_g1_i1:377-811(-)